MSVWEGEGFAMVSCEGFGVLRWRQLGFIVRFVFGLWFAFAVLKPAAALRPLRDRTRSWGDEVCVFIFLMLCVTSDFF